MKKTSNFKPQTSKKTKPKGPTPLPRRVSETYRKIYDTVEKIPRGRVASYGQVARVAGMERQARLVGYALHALSNDNAKRVPWQRVINAQGYCSIKEPPMAAEIQQRMLEQEGIEFSPRGKVDWKKYGWIPPLSPPRKRRGKQ